MDSFEDDSPEVPDNAPPRVAMDDLLGRKHKDNLMAAYFSGKIGSYLHPLGYTTSALVSSVEAYIEREFPTLKHQTVEMIRLLENQLIPGVLGSDLPRLVETEEGDLCERLDEFQAQTDRVQLLMSLRTDRLELLDELNCDAPVDELDQ
jgi:hypothetical protein